MISVSLIRDVGDSYWEWYCEECGMNAPFHYKEDAQLGAEVHEIYAHWPLKTWQPTVPNYLSGWYEICRAMRPRSQSDPGLPR